MNLLDDAIFDVDISIFHPVIVDNPSIFDEKTILRTLKKRKKSIKKKFHNRNLKDLQGEHLCYQLH